MSPRLKQLITSTIVIVMIAFAVSVLVSLAHDIQDSSKVEEIKRTSHISMGVRG